MSGNQEITPSGGLESSAGQARVQPFTLISNPALGASATGRARLQPFKFLDPYGPEDSAIFFGRDLEVAELYACFYRRGVTRRARYAA